MALHWWCLKFQAHILPSFSVLNPRRKKHCIIYSNFNDWFSYNSIAQYKARCIMCMILEIDISYFRHDKLSQFCFRISKYSYSVTESQSRKTRWEFQSSTAGYQSGTPACLKSWRNTKSPSSIISISTWTGLFTSVHIPTTMILTSG